MMEDKGNVDKILKKLEKKLNENPNLKLELRSLVNRIEEIFEADIELNIIHSYGVEEYTGLFNEYEENNLEYGGMTLKEVVDYLSNEDGNLLASIDPVYLKKGINEIDNIILTTFEDKVIIVPIIKKDENEKENNRD